jgi:hypothetical protein
MEHHLVYSVLHRTSDGKTDGMSNLTIRKLKRNQCLVCAVNNGVGVRATRRYVSSRKPYSEFRRLLGNFAKSIFPRIELFQRFIGLKIWKRINRGVSGLLLWFIQRNHTIKDPIRPEIGRIAQARTSERDAVSGVWAGQCRRNGRASVGAAARHAWTSAAPRLYVGTNDGSTPDFAKCLSASWPRQHRSISWTPTSLADFAVRFLFRMAMSEKSCGFPTSMIAGIRR